MKDLIAQLRCLGPEDSEFREVATLAADQIELMTKALEPFAGYANRVEHADEISRRHTEDEGKMFRPSKDSEDVVRGYINLGHCRRARAALTAGHSTP